KFVVYGAGAAGVMLYGTSLLAGIVGTGDLSQISVVLNQIAAGTSGLSDGTVRTVSLGIMLLLVGIAFKLSLVPFHFWCPDAFQGASAEVAGYLSVASKAGAFALLVRVCLSLSGPAPGAMSEVLLYFGIGLGVVASITATFGNLAAYTQTNVKRLLAYSTIAHAGYMLMAVAALLVVLNGEGVADRQELAMRCIEGLLYYLSVYLFMNLGAFAIVALIRNQIYSEEISDYNGLASQTPALCICMLICLFSLVGMPPFGGFVGKLMIFSSLFQSGAIHWSMYVVLCVGGLNTVFSLIYYIRVLKAMFMGDRPEGARRADIPLNSSPGFYVAMVTAPVVLLGVFVHLLSNRVYHLAKYIIQ
ncbi:MAG: proton-conducting transporter membrane subunit, partial [Planctomycetota bacterium]|nr:proton-conducting transporter membrane subunit [Planctomycetota bacterium]